MGRGAQWSPSRIRIRLLLYLLYVNDIPHRVKSKVKLFADDTKIWNRVGERTSSQALQQDIECLEEWSRKWLLQFNFEKCHVMHIGHKSNTKTTCIRMDKDVKSQSLD